MKYPPVLDGPALGQQPLQILNSPAHFSAKSENRIFFFFLNKIGFWIMSHLPTVGVSEADPKIPSQINPLTKEGNFVPVLLQPKV